MTGVITWVVDYSDGVCIGGKHLRYQLTQHTKPMTNTELTLNQLQAISGGGKEERQARREARRERRQEKRDIREAEREMKENLENGRYSCGCGPVDGPCRDDIESEIY